MPGRFPIRNTGRRLVPRCWERKGGNAMIRSLAARLFLLVVLGVALLACRTAQAPVPGQQGASDPRPNWSQDSYARDRRDDAWHFAYAVQSWAVEHNGHLIMVPARHNIVVAKSYFAE